MGFVKSCLKCYFEMFVNAFDIKGTISRGDYWKSQLIHGLIFSAVFAVALIVGKSSTDLMFGLFLGMSVIPVLTINIRRVRDAGWNPLWVLVMYIPVISLPFSLFVLTRKTEEENTNLKLVHAN